MAKKRHQSLLVCALFCLVIRGVSVQPSVSSGKQHPLCNNTRLEIVGTSAINESLLIFVHEDTAKRIVVYQVPVKNLVPFMGKIFINSKVESLPLADYCGYDPASHGKIPQSMFILEGPREDDITITYIFKEDKQSAQSVSCSVQKPYSSLMLNGTQNAIVWSSSFKGLHFIRGNELKNWVARDVSYMSKQLWFGSNFYNVLLNSDGQMVFRLSNPKSNEKPVQWKSINGFIQDSLYVTLFVDHHVLIYADPFIGSHPTADFTIDLANFTYEQMFTCQEEVPGVILELRGLQPKDTGKTKLYIIFSLFGLHFLAAFVMLAIIVKVYAFDFKSQRLQSSVKQQNSRKVRLSSKGQSSKSDQTLASASSTSENKLASSQS